jgi:hypothetical protein
MIIERTYNGGWCVSSLVKGSLVTRRYFGYTKKEAVRLFKQETSQHG